MSVDEWGSLAEYLRTRCTDDAVVPDTMPVERDGYGCQATTEGLRMQNECLRCGRGFVAHEPFVRVETLVRIPDAGNEAQFAVTKSSLCHLTCAPWGDPKYRIERPT